MVRYFLLLRNKCGPKSSNLLIISFCLCFCCTAKTQLLLINISFQWLFNIWEQKVTVQPIKISMRFVRKTKEI